MADRQPIPGSSAANPEFRGSVRAEDGGQVFVYNGGLDFDETGEFVVSRGPNVVLEVIDASAMSAPDRPASSEAVAGHVRSTSNCVLPPRSVSSHCCSAGTSATASAERLGPRRRRTSSHGRPRPSDLAALRGADVIRDA